MIIKLKQFTILLDFWCLISPYITVPLQSLRKFATYYHVSVSYGSLQCRHFSDNAPDYSFTNHSCHCDCIYGKPPNSEPHQTQFLFLSFSRWAGAMASFSSTISNPRHILSPNAMAHDTKHKKICGSHCRVFPLHYQSSPICRYI